LKRPRGAALEMPVYICEYHDEALRCLHHAIRRRRMPFSDLTMVHLDAHPDLGASATMSAETIFASPHDVYAAMRTDVGGIAQWILPAVYGGHFRCVWWIRPPWAVQIADGDYAVAVGRAKRTPEGAQIAPAHRVPPRAPVAGAPVHGAAAPPGGAVALGAGLPDLGAAGELPEVICISCTEPYFVEDGIYCPEGDMQAAKPLRLLVSQLPEGAGKEAGEGQPGESSTNSFCRQPEELVTGQPWMLDVCLDYFACGNPFLRQTRPAIAAPFAAVQNGAAFRQQGVADVAEFLASRDAFDKAYNAVLKAAIADDAEADADEIAIEAIGAFLPAEERETLLADLRSALDEAKDSELQEILEAVDMVTLPLHPVTEAEVRERLAAFDAFLGRILPGGKPAVVTIARSVVDGFCPMRWHCMLEQGVLEVLRGRLGELEVLYADELDAMENL